MLYLLPNSSRKTSSFRWAQAARDIRQLAGSPSLKLAVPCTRETDDPARPINLLFTSGPVTRYSHNILKYIAKGSDIIRGRDQERDGLTSTCHKQVGDVTIFYLVCVALIIVQNTTVRPIVYYCVWYSSVSILSPIRFFLYPKTHIPGTKYSLYGVKNGHSTTHTLFVWRFV